MRERVPRVDEPHLFELDKRVRKMLGADNVFPWTSLIEQKGFRHQLLHVTMT